ncbi:hypothetical protein L9F63_013859, partial [Diploptera punctata]
MARAPAIAHSGMSKLMAFARRRQGSLPKEPPPSVDISDSDGEKDSGLDDFEIIKTIGIGLSMFTLKKERKHIKKYQVKLLKYTQYCRMMIFRFQLPTK